MLDEYYEIQEMAKEQLNCNNGESVPEICEDCPEKSHCAGYAEIMKLDDMAGR